MTQNPYQVLIKPVITERAWGEGNLATLCFQVDATRRNLRFGMRFRDFLAQSGFRRTATFTEKPAAREDPRPAPMEEGFRQLRRVRRCPNTPERLSE